MRLDVGPVAVEQPAFDFDVAALLEDADLPELGDVVAVAVAVAAVDAVAGASVVV